MLFFFFFFKQKTAYEIGVRLVGSEMCIRDSHGCRHHGCLYRQDLYRGETSPTILHRRKSIILSKKEDKKNINLIDTKIASVLIIPMLFLYLITNN